MPLYLRKTMWDFLNLAEKSHISDKLATFPSPATIIIEANRNKFGIKELTRTGKNFTNFSAASYPDLESPSPTAISACAKKIEPKLIQIPKKKSKKHDSITKINIPSYKPAKGTDSVIFRAISRALPPYSSNTPKR
ncbi:hypothetical protein L6452_11496 [Arctium lappa]|uniref:Uncharacterized protein n=1 Tax=Arctium lappa TaxID=4217 RepID=A0ACB9DP04_ARCLA|nr:hypothetical protein L6452_11496 [Arctium lappa]